MKLNWKIKPEYKAISEVKGLFSDKLIAEGIPFSYDIEMGFTELMENAIKYSQETPDYNDINVKITLDNRILDITLSNYVKTEDDLRSLSTIINRINEYGKSENLYLDRINEIISQDGIGKSQLGLYRIAYEAEFAISWEKTNNNQITITIKKQV
ncbi:MAG: hypothetical protein II707_00795 [Spirochaetales bacterium]|nr:hypothetical protein [Spirochaetales bacterium]